MATFLRLGSRHLCRSVLSAQYMPRVVPVSCISTSKTNKDAITAEETIQQPAKSRVEQTLDEKEENWLTFGYSFVDREEDQYQHHMWMFFSIGALMWVGFFLAYYPDMSMRDWTQREAYLQLEYREKNGLPLIDPNAVDPEKMKEWLPTEEELGDFEIVI